ncbi:MAG: sulfur carrier protein ThiS adenylyltransferase ThiF [Thermodesulfobacteriota bacterium]
MNDFEKGIIKILGKKKYSLIKEKKIAVLGAGGLGSNAAFNLVRCGFTNFVLADFDVVEPSNLNRQFYFFDQVGEKKTKALKKNLLMINPDIKAELYEKKIETKDDLKFFKDCDAVVEAFDKSIYKKITAEYFMKRKNLLVSGSGISQSGRSDDIRIRKINPCFYIAGDFVSETDTGNPPFSPCVNITAAKQADIVFHYFANFLTKD